MIYSIKDNFINRIEVKKSIFITYLYKVYSVEDCNKIIKSIKEKHCDATHCCYGYIINNEQKASDDGEPSKTAGVPILEILKKNNFNYILCIVVRYFGGIKLGAGGLIRTYSLAAKEAINSCNKVYFVDGYRISITIDYSQIEKLEYLLKDCNIIDKKFDINPTYIIDIDKEFINKLNNYNYEIINNIEIEKDL